MRIGPSLIASSRGHEVLLYEKAQELGGALHLAAAPPFKADMKRYLDWLIRQTQKSSVEIKLSTEATVDMIRKENPDVIIVALGAEPFIPDVPGIHHQNVVLAGAVDSGTASIGNNVVVVGAGGTVWDLSQWMLGQRTLSVSPTSCERRSPGSRKSRYRAEPGQATLQHKPPTWPLIYPRNH